jgi:hypothetical protein
MTFNALADQIKTIITNSTEVSGVLSPLSKIITTKIGFRTRQEINLSELPVALIVRPERKLTLDYAKQYQHSFLLFVGIHCETREDAPGRLDDLENAIEDALATDWTLDGNAVNVEYVGSVNDMGLYHPVYFTTMQFDISARK